MIIDTIKARAKQNSKRIILNEVGDLRILTAATTCTSEKLAEIVLIGDPSAPAELAAENNISLDSLNFVNPAESPLADEFAAQLFDLRKDKGLTLDDAQNLIHNDPMYFSCMYLRNGYADGMVSGACHATADTLRPALQTLRRTGPSTASQPEPSDADVSHPNSQTLRQTDNLVSAFFLMEVPDCEYGTNGIFIFADSGLNQNPDPAQLVCIAADSAVSFKNLVNAEPNVAFLSHSTLGSASHPDVEKVAAAVKIAKQQYPDLNLDGELQADAALDSRAASLKHAEHSPVAGKANVLIFPDLDAGNIGYKLVQYLAKAKAYGPIAQGFMRPVNDLSRGCTVEDIIGVIAITSLQAML